MPAEWYEDVIESRAPIGLMGVGPCESTSSLHPTDQILPPSPPISLFARRLGCFHNLRDLTAFDQPWSIWHPSKRRLPGYDRRVEARAVEAAPRPSSPSVPTASRQTS